MISQVPLSVLRKNRYTYEITTTANLENECAIRRRIIEYLPDINRTRLSGFAGNMVSYMWNSALNTFSCSTSNTRFKNFCNAVFFTTEVSFYVALLALYYVYRLKNQLSFASGAPGSEYFIFTVALILANKYLDDNTFTNQSWARVSGIPLKELNRIEREFLEGINFRLHVTEKEFLLWLQLLGHYWNKEILGELAYKCQGITSREDFISNRYYWRIFLNTSPILSPCAPSSNSRSVYCKKADLRLASSQTGVSNLVDTFP